MKRKTIFVVSLLSTVLLAVLVYAYTYDSDGGFNVFVQGTCYDNIGNHTDNCPAIGQYPQSLIEWFPVNGTNSTSGYCVSKEVDCAKYNGTCSQGTCVSGR